MGKFLEPKFQGAKVCKNFRSREQKGRPFHSRERNGQGANGPGNKRAKERKGQGANWPGSYWPIRSWEQIGLGAKTLWQVPSTPGVLVTGAHVKFSDAVKLLGVTLDSTQHGRSTNITNVTRCCHYHIRAMRHIRPLLTLDTAKTIAASIVVLDYCNSLLYGMSQANIDRLQRAQNVLAQVVAQAPTIISSADIRRDLHWLPINHRISYKISLLTWKALYTAEPSYLSELISPYIPARTLRYSNTYLLSIPTAVTSHFSSRSFSVSAPSTWNSLPQQFAL